MTMIFEVRSIYRLRTFEIIFKESFIKNNVGKEIVINYSAEVTKDAVYTIGNKAGIDYNHAPGQDSNKETEEEKVYTFGIDLTKKDANNGIGLNNAEFTLSDGTDKVIEFVVNNGETEVTEKVTYEAAGTTRYAFKGKTADGRPLTAFVSKAVWDKMK